MNDKPTVQPRADFCDSARPADIRAQVNRAWPPTIVCSDSGWAYCSWHGIDNYNRKCKRCVEALHLTVANDRAAMDDAARRPPAGEIPPIPPLSAEAWSRVWMADTRSKEMKRLMDQMCGLPRPDLGKAMREAEEEGSAVRRAMALLGTAADDDRLLLDLLCNEIERLRDEHAASGDKHEAQGQIEHLDRENERLRRELAAMKASRDGWQDQARVWVSTSTELRRRLGESGSKDGVVKVDPFPDVKPYDDSWPPPSHRPRMLP